MTRAIYHMQGVTRIFACDIVTLHVTFEIMSVMCCNVTITLKHLISSFNVPQFTRALWQG